jgi:dTDP-4-dehydrorhamnose reductase
MTILVTGANGQVGRELITIGRQANLAIHGIDIEDVDFTDAVALERSVEDLELEGVVNAAAYTAVDLAETEPEKTFAANVEGPRNLADICARRQIPLIHISTDYVYDGLKRGAYMESDPVAPQGIYAESKARGDATVAEQLDTHIIIRTAWVYSVHGHNFVKTMLRLFREKKTVSVVNDQLGCPTHAADIADAIIQIMLWIKKNQKTPAGIYHYCGQGSTSWYGFAKKILMLAAPQDRFTVTELLPIPTSAYPTPVRRPANSVLDCSKIKKTFGIEPVPWEDGLRHMLERYYR